MKKKILSALLIALAMTGSFYVGTTRAKTEVVTETVTETVEVVPDGYIKLEDCIPLADINGYFYDDYDYLCFELGDFGNQLDDPNNTSYAEICKKIPRDYN
jgi:hypothetical protein